MSTTIDLADAVVTTVVASGTTLLIGLVWGRREKATERLVQPRRARREELRHRAPELPDEGEQQPDTTAPEPADEQVLTGYTRFAGLAAGSSIPSQRRHLADDWHRQFDHIVELYGETPRPDDEPTPFYDATTAALVMPTAEWQTLGQPATYPTPTTDTDVPVRQPDLGETNPWDKPQPGPPSPKPQVATQPDNPPSNPTIPAKPLVGQPRVPAVIVNRIHQAAQRALAGVR